MNTIQARGTYGITLPDATFCYLAFVRRRMMILFILSAGIALPIIASAENTNEVTLVRFTTTRGKEMQCRISEDRIMRDRKWDIIKADIPLEPKKAYAIAEAWVVKRSPRVALLMRMEILPLGTRSKSLDGHYCYIVEFSAFTTIREERVSLAILMDGTLIEPTFVTQ